MEILNKNQRETAVWRLVGFGFLVLLANAFVMFASFKAFQDKGAGDANDLRKKLEECQYTLRGKTNDFQVEEGKYKQQIKELKDKLKNKDPEKLTLEGQLKILQTENQVLNSQLSRCQQSQK